jgi:hypothetical protein
MRGLKGMDFFQKISMDNVTQPTLIGSFLSIFAIILMIYLLLRDVIDFYSTKTKRDAVVIQDKNQYEKIPLHLELRLPNVPCNLVSLDQEDTLRNHRLDISDTIKKYKILNGKNNELFKYDKHNNYKNLVNALNSNEGCFINGYVDISKVPGNIHLSFHNYASEWNSLTMTHRNLANKVNLNHKFDDFFFGKIGKKFIFRFQKKTKGFFRDNDLPNFLNLKTKKNFDYFIKIIPYQFVDENRGITEYSYEYSISYKESDYVEERDDMPIILIRYEFTPITMRVTILKRNYLHFLTHVCAIVGGVFVIFSLLNKIIVGMFDFSNQISQQ